ncbi:MAG: hypothetical protein ACKVS5_02325 [Parvularculaceae bacterium]
MRERSFSVLGDLAAGRPLLVSSVIAIGLAALTASAFRGAPASFASVGYSYLAALAVMTTAPAAIASMAPRNVWLRLFYSGVAAGLILAVRRIAIQSGFEPASFSVDIAFAGAAIVTGALSLCAPLWRGALRLAVVGLCAVTLGAAGGLSIIALEAARSGAVPAAGAALGFSAAIGAAFCVFLANVYCAEFSGGAGGAVAAARAVRAISAPALLSVCLAIVALGAGAFLAGMPLQSAAYVGAGVMAVGLVASILMGAAALALKAPTEMTAIEENRRRAGLAPLLRALRATAPPSTSIAASAILLIATVVTGFDAASAASLAEIVIIAAAFAVALVAFVSVRSALLLVIMLIVGTRLSLWGAERLLAEAPAENVRVIAAALAAVIYSHIVLAWRDNRSPRRKALDVTGRAIADSASSYAAASVLAAAALASADAAGLWEAGSEAALFTAAVLLVGAASAPVLMTAMGAVFGRE